MSGKKICYKVVRPFRDEDYQVVPGKYRSSGTESEGIYVIYEVGKRAKPKVKGSPLFVFRNLPDARMFTETGIILECEYTTEIVMLSGMSMIEWVEFDTNGPEWLAKQWREALKGEFGWRWTKYGVPVGTMFVASVLPIRVVDRFSEYEKIDS